MYFDFNYAFQFFFHGSLWCHGICTPTCSMIAQKRKKKEPATACLNQTTHLKVKLSLDLTNQSTHKRPKGTQQLSCKCLK